MEKNFNIGDKVKYLTQGNWYNHGVISEIHDNGYLIEVFKFDVLYPGMDPHGFAKLQKDYPYMELENRT